MLQMVRDLLDLACGLGLRIDSEQHPRRLVIGEFSGRYCLGMRPWPRTMPANRTAVTKVDFGAWFEPQVSCAGMGSEPLCRDW